MIEDLYGNRTSSNIASLERRVAISDPSGKGFQAVRSDELRSGKPYLLSLHSGDGRVCICGRCMQAQRDGNTDILVQELTEIYGSGYFGSVWRAQYVGIEEDRTYWLIGASRIPAAFDTRVIDEGAVHILERVKANRTL